jgi:Right handed beta helix region
MKTLAQIEPRTPISSLPFTIQASGSYYLTTNLTGAAGDDGVIIDASDVTLDLAGFTLSGLTGALDGIRVLNSHANLVIRNGTLTHWTSGIDAQGASNSHFESLRLSQNTGQGLWGGPASAVTDCASYSNQGTGISVDQDCQLTHCSGSSNGMHGIFADSGSQLFACAASGNLGNGVVLGSRCIITACLAANNGESGIVAADSLHISDSQAASNGLLGISAGTDAAFYGCSVSGNMDTGIAATQSAQVLDCKAVANARGIAVQSGSMIRGCAALANSGDGIQVDSACTVVGNTATANFLARDAAGIHASGPDNIIRENSMLSNDMGLVVDVAGNFIVKNTAANNTLNYRIVDTSQAVGPIISSSDVKNANNPVANFEF